MWCITIRAETVDVLESEFQEAKRHATLIECRLDGFSEIPFATLERLASQAKIIVSLHQKKGSLNAYRSLARLGIYALDIPHTVAHDVFTQMQKEFPELLIIASYHNFDQTPEGLSEIFDTLYKLPADYYKCVTMAHSSLDGLKMLTVLKSKAKSMPTIAFCMGQEALFTRQLAPIFGSRLSYCSLPNKPTALGQQAFHERIDVTDASAIYALIGDPIAHSLSHITHNAVFQKNSLDCIYVKISVKEFEFSSCMHYFASLGFKGLSVTMPLKAKLGGNTCRFVCQSYDICNTDGVGMLDAIEEKTVVQNKEMLILGAGFTAKTIASEAIKRGANVSIANRTQEKAAKIASELGCNVVLWDKKTVQKGFYDILVNATSIGMNVHDELLFEKEDLPSNILVADVIWPNETKLLRMAKEMGSCVVYGHEMWLFQAAYQFAFWTSLSKQKAYNDLHEAFSCLK